MSTLYDRQTTLDLDTDKRIIVCGVGGIGWNCAKMLAMAGVKEVVCFDADTVEIHNLPRLDIPMTCLGKNKADLLERMVKQMRPDASFTGFPFWFNPDVIKVGDYDILVDCTDKFDTQVENKGIADGAGIGYIKAGYDGLSITISNTLPEWDTGNHQDGYRVIPSYVSPAVIVAALTVQKILSNSQAEIFTTIDKMFNH